MPRNMSCAITTQQVRDYMKDVTRRDGWRFLKPGDLVQLVEKGQGLKKGEKIKRLHLVRIVKTGPEILRRLIDEPEYGEIEVQREGFEGILTPAEFIEMFCKSHKGCTPYKIVNRIEWEYVHIHKTEMDSLLSLRIPKGKRCKRCAGTGNELYSMYRKCQACGGNGVSKGKEDTFED